MNTKKTMPTKAGTVAEDCRAVRIRHTVSGQYLALRESQRIHVWDCAPPDYAMHWGPEDEASVMIATTARAVAAAWMSLADDADVEIEAVPE